MFDVIGNTDLPPPHHTVDGCEGGGVDWWVGGVVLCVSMGSVELDK